MIEIDFYSRISRKDKRSDGGSNKFILELELRASSQGSLLNNVDKPIKRAIRFINGKPGNNGEKIRKC